MPPALFAQRLADDGAESSINVKADYVTIDVQALREHWADAVKIIADGVQHPDLRAPAVESIRAELASEQTARSHNDSALGLDLVQHAIYESHPYANTLLSDLATYPKIRTTDVPAFHRSMWNPRNASIVVVGDVEAAEARAVLQAAFGDWRADAHASVAELTRPPAQPRRPLLLVVDRPTTTQPTIVTALRIASRRSPDWYATFIANTILGGTFDARLNADLRTKRGWSYVTYSQLVNMAQDGLFYVATAVHGDVVGDATREILDQLDGMRLKPPTSAEIEIAKRTCQIVATLELEKNDDIANALTPLAGLGMPLTELGDRATRFGAVSLADVLTIAIERLPSERASVVIVGPAATIVPQLRKRGLDPATVSAPK